MSVWLNKWVEQLEQEYDLRDLYELLPPLHKHHNQLSLKNTGTDDWYEGCGSLKWSYDHKGGRTLRDVPLKNEDFTHLHSSLMGTVFEEINDRYPCGRMRFMGLPHKKCLSWHQDTTKRLHIPVITDPACRMVVDDVCFHMEAGKTYIVNTLPFHSAFNGTHDLMRIHLVLDLL